MDRPDDEERVLCEAFALSNVKSASVRVTWMTEEAHAITLTGLSTNTRYHYRVESEDEAGKLAASADLTFKTAR